MKCIVILLFSVSLFASCKQSAFTCYICKSTAITDSAGVKKYVNLADYTKCNVAEAAINKYQSDHNIVDTSAPDVVIETVTLCSRF
jgi:uncharacterized lipoprotein YajG